MSRVSRGTPGGEAYLDLRGQARRTGRLTQELLQLYVLEGFLARLAVSDVSDSFVLKGGVLLAAYDTRRPTKDIDLAGLKLTGDTEIVLDLVRAVLDAPMPDESDDDGIEFLPATATAASGRDSDPSQGLPDTHGACGEDRNRGPARHREHALA